MKEGDTQQSNVDTLKGNRITGRLIESIKEVSDDEEDSFRTDSDGSKMGMGEDELDETLI